MNEEKKYQTLIFDLDGTLAESKSPLAVDMAGVFAEASNYMNMVIITGGAFSQIEKQVISLLPETAKLQNIYVLPTTGSVMYQYKDNEWRIVYENVLSDNETKKIEEAFEQALLQTSFSIAPEELSGPQLENRKSQFTFSALGQEQTVEKKKAWDPDRKKREELQSFLVPLLPEFDVKIGGTTSIDVTPAGINKAYGIRRFFKEAGFSIDAGLFVGDEIQEGGNDYAAIETGIDTYQTKGPHDTMNLILRLLQQYR